MGIGSSHGRAIRYLRVSVTDRCNLRCVYCMPAGRPTWLPAADTLTSEEIERVVRCAVACGVEKVRLTGGEPLLRPGLPGLAARLRRLPGLRELVLSTNGLLLTRLARPLRAAGVDRINVSLDSLHPATFAALTRGGSLAAVLAGLEAAAAAGFPLKLNCVVMRGVNDAEVGHLARFGLERGWEVRFIEYMPVGCGAGEWRRRFVPAAETLARLERELGPLTPVGDAPGAPARHYRVPGYAAPVGVIAALSRPFCAGCDRLRLTADGRVRTCLLAPGEADLRPLLRGDARDEEIAAALVRAARLKPRWHGVAAGPPQRAMSQVGG